MEKKCTISFGYHVESHLEDKFNNYVYGIFETSTVKFILIVAKDIAIRLLFKKYVVKWALTFDWHIWKF